MSQSTLAFSAESSQSTFNFGEHAVRIIVRNGEPWFVAKDLCDALEIKNSRDSLSALDADERGVGLTDTPSKNQHGSFGTAQQRVQIVNESGMYTLVLRCRDAIKPGTVPYRFRKWVTSEVLPSIRKTGGYGQISQERLEIALAMAGEVAAVAHRHVMQAVLAGEDASWDNSRWAFMFNLTDPRFNRGNGFVKNGWAKRIPHDVIMESPSELAESIRNGKWSVTSEALAAIISACASRLEMRSRQGCALTV